MESSKRAREYIIRPYKGELKSWIEYPLAKQQWRLLFRETT